MNLDFFAESLFLDPYATTRVVTVTPSGRYELDAIFVTQYQIAAMAQDYESATPYLLIKTTELKDIGQDTSVNISNSIYFVEHIEPSEGGVTKLTLKKNRVRT